MVGSYLLQMNLRSGRGALGPVTGAPLPERVVTLKTMVKMVVTMPTGRAMGPHSWVPLCHHHLR
jgi:hypothetical protein